jgi:hypothetical protein
MNDVQLLLLAANNNRTASVNGAGVDVTNGVGGFNPGEGGVPVQAAIPIVSIDHTTGDETYQFKLQDSPDNATWTDISPNRAASDYSGPNATGAGGTVYVGGFLRQQYVRLVATLGGTTPILNHGDIYLQVETPKFG